MELGMELGCCNGPSVYGIGNFCASTADKADNSQLKAVKVENPQSAGREGLCGG